MGSHTYNGSNAADRAAKKDGRFFKGKVYDKKSQAEAARRAASSFGGATRPSAGPSKGGRGKGGVGRETMVVEIDQTAAWAATRFCSVALNGAEADTSLAAFNSRNYKVLGVRLEAGFPFVAGVSGRWAAATTHKLSSGDKTVIQVASVRGAVKFDTVNQVDTFVTMKDVGCSNPRKEDGTTLVEDQDLRHVVWAMEGSHSGTERVTVKWHVTIQVDKEAAAKVNL